MLKESIVPCCETMLGVNEEEIIPPDALNGDGILLELLAYSSSTDDCKAVLLSEVRKTLFGRILTLSGDPVFISPRRRVGSLLQTYIRWGWSEGAGWALKEGGVLCADRKVGDKKERDDVYFTYAWEGITGFYEKEGDAWREEKGTRKERKMLKMREVMWMKEGEGKLDVSLAFQHHTNTHVREYSEVAAGLFRMCAGSGSHIPLTFVNEECWGRGRERIWRDGNNTPWETFSCTKIITSVSSLFLMHLLIFILRAFGNCFIIISLSLSNVFFLVAHLTPYSHL
jgi:hypothetical protein